MDNPIRENRVVVDKTFARRLKSHCESTTSSCAMGHEELEYLHTVADRLLEYQLQTCPESEKSYHENCDKEIDWTKYNNPELNSK